MSLPMRKRCRKSCCSACRACAAGCIRGGSLRIGRCICGNSSGATGHCCGCAMSCCIWRCGTGALGGALRVGRCICGSPSGAAGHCSCAMSCGIWRCRIDARGDMTAACPVGPDTASMSTGDASIADWPDAHPPPDESSLSICGQGGAADGATGSPVVKSEE
eukprot:scaffold1895_cov123-Isochrysis_galbana.AAC.2